MTSPTRHLHALPPASLSPPAHPLPSTHFLSIQQPSVTAVAAENVPPTSTLAGADFDVDVRSGFLPPEEPLRRLGGEWEVWESALGAAMEGAVSLHGVSGDGEQWRRAVREMPIIPTPPASHDIRPLRRAYTVLSFLAHFYVHSSPASPSPSEDPTGGPAGIVPRSLSLPWMDAASRLGLPPVLTYAATVLWNWAYRDPAKGYTIDNLYSPITFTRTPSEQHFYLTSAIIESQGVPALRLMSASMDEAFLADLSPSISFPRIASHLRALASHIDTLTATMSHMRDACDPPTFYHLIRPWFNGPNGAAPGRGWAYEGADAPGVTRAYGGPSAGQSSLVHALDAFLSVDHAPLEGGAGYDDTFMRRMQAYMPAPHREFLTHLLENPTPIKGVVMGSGDEGLKMAYNESVQAMKRFRDEHIRIATLYVVTQARAAHRQPAGDHIGEVEAEVKGTGGTALVRFLKMCRDRTTDALVHI